jgi:hypothetical protein
VEEPRPNQSGSRNGLGGGLLRLREITLEVADGLKGPIAEARERWTRVALWSDGHTSPCHLSSTQIIVNVKGL